MKFAELNRFETLFTLAGICANCVDNRDQFGDVDWDFVDADVRIITKTLGLGEATDEELEEVIGELAEQDRDRCGLLTEDQVNEAIEAALS